MTTGGVLLYPNLGAEQGPNVSLGPAQCAAAILWRLLFGPCAWVRLRRPYPFEHCQAFDFLSDRSAFDWLAHGRGLVPWYGDHKAAWLAQREGLPLWAPNPDVVRQVHDKAFAVQHAIASSSSDPKQAEFDRCISILDAELLGNEDEALALIGRRLQEWPERFRPRFTLKPRLGSSGRGRIPGTPDTIDSAAFQRGLARLADAGGAILEPFVERKLDLSAQFFVHPGGRVEFLGSLGQRLSQSGSYQGHFGCIDVRGRATAGTEWDEALHEHAAKVVDQAAKRGFWGPCGVDAFVYPSLLHRNRLVLRPVVEFNARFTVGVVVLGLLRRIALDKPCRYRFELDAGESAEKANSSVRMLPTLPGRFARLIFE